MALQEFSNTDAELARCIKSRLRHELNNLSLTADKEAVKKEVREYLIELTQEIINEDF